MEANEAPEKIYMTPSFGEPNNILLASFSKSHLNFHRDVEYIRADTFIEKAIKWLKEHADDYNYTWYNEMEGESGITDECIEDFKAYMKGE